MDCVRVRHAFPQSTCPEIMTVLYLQFRNALNSSKTLVNNIVAPRLVTYQIQQSLLSVCIQVHTPSVTTCTVSKSLRDTVDKCDAARLIFGGRSQSYCEPWDRLPEFKTRSQTLIASFLRPVHSIFSPLSPLVVCLLVFHPSTLHSSSSLVTRPDASDSGVLPPSPSPSLPSFLSSSLFLSFLLSFPVLLLAHLSCGCLCKLCVLSY